MHCHSHPAVSGVWKSVQLCTGATNPCATPAMRRVRPEAPSTAMAVARWLAPAQSESTGTVGPCNVRRAIRSAMHRGATALDLPAAYRAVLCNSRHKSASRRALACTSTIALAHASRAARIAAAPMAAMDRSQMTVDCAWRTRIST
jgi:hypothetical protein